MKVKTEVLDNAYKAGFKSAECYRNKDLAGAKNEEYYLRKCRALVGNDADSKYREGYKAFNDQYKTKPLYFR